MPAWLLPALKAVLPHVGTILSAAAPVFTKKNPEEPATHTSSLHQQVTELQAAAATSDAHIKDLAMQVRTMLEVIEQGTALAERRYQRLLKLCLAMGAVAVISMGVVLLLFLR